MKNINSRVSEKVHTYLETNFKTKSAGAEIAIEAFPVLRETSLIEIKGVFSESEINAIADAYNGAIFEVKFISSKGMFIAQMQDSELFDDIGAKWGIDVNSLIEKIKKMPIGHVFFFLLEIDRFWNLESAYGSPTPSLSRLVEKLC